jgi:hypothetical protein
VRERLINRRQQGDLGEASAIEWLTRQGATVAAPVGYSPDYDLVGDLVGRLIRVQVKTSVVGETTSSGAERCSVNVCTNGETKAGPERSSTSTPKPSTSCSCWSVTGAGG